MRWYDIVPRILLILSIFDVALAAPVLVQEKRQASVDVVHMPRGMITGWWRRGEGELEKLAEEYLKTSGKSVESSEAHASSSSAPPGHDHGSTNVVQTSVPNPASSDAHASSSSAPPVPDREPTNVVQAPAPNPASSTADPNLLTKPSSPSSNVPESPAQSDSEDYEWLFEPEDGDEIHKPLHTPTSSGHASGLNHEFSSVPQGPNHGSTNVVQAPAPNPALSTANPNPLIELSSSESSSSLSWPSEGTLPDSEHKWLLEPQGDDKSHRLLYTPFVMSSGEFTGAQVKRPWTNPEGPPPKRPAVSKEFRVGKAPDLGSSDSDWNHHPILDPGPVSVVNPLFTLPAHEDVTPFTLWTEPTHEDLTPFTVSTRPGHEVVTPPSPNPGWPPQFEYKVVDWPPPSPDLELRLGHQSLSTDSQPIGLQAAIYAAKGKAKESRRISGPTRDIGNAA